TADVELGGWLPRGRTFEAGELARPPSSGAAAAAARDLRGHLEVAVRRRMPSSGAVAVLLSGGIDSSLVTALAARTPGATVATYSIGFGDHLPNELGYAGLVASHCATAHHEVRFDGYEVAAGLAAAVRQLDNPVGDPLTVPNALLDERIAADGHRVVLNGEGGDPVFGGPKNLPMIGWELTRIDPSPGARADAYLASYRKLWGHLDQLLTPAFAARLEGSLGPGRWVEPHLHDAAASAYLDRLLLTNLRTKGANHIQHKVERLSAAAGIEARAPLFDLDVVTAAFRMHPALKLAGTVEKAVLKDAVRDLLPVTIVDRPKSGMRVPVQAWLAGPLRAAARELLVGERALDRGLFRPEPIRAWLDGGAMVWPRQGLAVWMLLTLELWLRWFLDGDAEVDVDLGPPPRRRRFPTANRGARGLG
ncbi:MAG: asparagine synthase C-terminal domain-containing protein, partial [Acidimicrobiia bacterium]|nr:asparagine synthase C-terminal domain-containing protein [Acidimicrobiia bacterium]